MAHVGIYGGSFNPLHNGHIQLALALCREQRVDEVWFMVSPQNPLKETPDLLDERIRLQMVRDALTPYPCLKACDEEFRLPRPSYMWRTLAALRTNYPEHTFSLIIGADNWVLFSQWSCTEEILANHRLIIYPRTGYPIIPEQLPTGVCYVSLPLYPVSSTEIRKKIKTGKDISQDVPPVIRNRILTEGLYTE